MSSEVTRLKKKLNKEIDPLYNTLAGSICVTYGILLHHNVKAMREVFKYLKKNYKTLNLNTVMDIVQAVEAYHRWDSHLNELRANIVLVYDDTNVRTPMVTLVNDEGEVMPLRREGFTEVNILTLAYEGDRDWIKVEYLFDENGNYIKNES